MNHIQYAKNDSASSKRNFERMFETNMNNNLPIQFNRIQQSTRFDKAQDFNLSQYSLCQRANLGYSNLFENNNVKPETNSNINRMEFQDKILPPNIYHNFSVSTRLAKKTNH